MDEHRRSTLSEDQNGQILDRLSGLEKGHLAGRNDKRTQSFRQTVRSPVQTDQ